jgi:hypothetical protein
VSKNTRTFEVIRDGIQQETSNLEKRKNLTLMKS